VLAAWVPAANWGQALPSEALQLGFNLPAGTYATAVPRELVSSKM